MDENIVTVMRERAATYGFFARLLAAELDEALLGQIAGMALPAGTDEDFGQGVLLMEGFLCGAKNDLGGARTRLAVDFAHLFLVRDAHETQAPYPFESAYSSPEHTLVSDARTDARRRYRSFGLVVSDSWNVGEDHVALELQYMQFLASTAAAALETGDGQTARRALDEQADFLKEHLRRWMPLFCARMGKWARTDFYRGLARCIDGFLREDEAFLGQGV